MLMRTGLYKQLVDSELLIPHSESSEPPFLIESCSLVIEPRKIPFISYPYEWCFSQLKDAALLTLEIQETALKYGMSLKDASVYNVQYYMGKPVFIDTLSFEKYKEGEPWIAYRQFCEHFLAPLVLMKNKDVRLNQLLKANIDGIPMDLVAKLLPLGSKFSFSIFSHIVAHAKSQKHFESKQIQQSNYSMSKFQHRAMIDGLKSFIAKLNWMPKGFEWGDYYKDTNYSDESAGHKRDIIASYLAQTPPGFVIDIGGNIGTYSRLASAIGRETLCIDIDPAAIEKNYLVGKKEKEINLLPLIMDITNPSPGIGWANQERHPFFERSNAETIMVLALIHHLAISNNVPLQKISDVFSLMCNYCIIEWVPKEDSQVQRLLSTRKDIFPEYTQEYFEESFKQNFEIIERKQINKSLRVLYLIKTR